jgi:hypothetical protein
MTIGNALSTCTALSMWRWPLEPNRLRILVRLFIQKVICSLLPTGRTCRSASPVVISHLFGRWHGCWHFTGFEYGSRMFFGRLRIRLKAFACQAKASRALAAIPPISSTLTCMFLIGRAHFMAAVFPRTPAIADLFAARPLLSSVKRGKYLPKSA